MGIFCRFICLFFHRKSGNLIHNKNILVAYFALRLLVCDISSKYIKLTYSDNHFMIFVLHRPEKTEVGWKRVGSLEQNSASR